MRIHIDNTMLGCALAGLAGLVAAGLAYTAALAPSRVQSRLGGRGYKRQCALAEGGSFGTLEPLIRWFGQRLSGLVPERLCEIIEARLVQAGDWFGLTPEELVAVMIASGMLGAGAGAVLGRVCAIGAIVPASVGFLVGAYLVHAKLEQVIQRRAVELTHALPYVTDLVSLAMTAGLDFPGALRNVLERSGDRQNAIHDELERVLHEMSLGHTRVFALEQFAHRTRVPAVTEFVQTMVQAEQRGAPLVQVFSIQAKVARQRRAAQAEERAEKMNTQLLFPISLLSLSISVVLTAPFLLTTMDGFIK
jgi:tight adherence protein C